jgi:hypothetical protein
MRQPVTVAVQMAGVRCTFCGAKFDKGEEVLWRTDPGGGLFHRKCPAPVMLEREACLQVLERRMAKLEEKLRARFPGDDGTETEHASSPYMRSALENLRIVHGEIAGGDHVGDVMWPPTDRDEEPETWRLLADTACEILGRWDVVGKLDEEDQKDANAAFEMLGRLVDKTERVEKS